MVTNTLGEHNVPIISVEMKMESVGFLETLSTTYQTTKTKLTPWPQFASEFYRPSDRRMSAKLMPTFADSECCVLSATDPCGRILCFLDRSHYFFFQVAPQLYSRG
jgi:hypothetical protein